MKRLISGIITVVFFAMICFNGYGDSINAVGYSMNIKEDGSIYDMESSAFREVLISKELLPNISVTNAVFGENAEKHCDCDSRMRIEINKDMTRAYVSFDYFGENRTALLNGMSSEIRTKDGSGYTGWYEGIMQPFTNRELACDTNGYIPVNIDVTFDSREVFATITMGLITENKNPDILFYGDYSEKIAKMADASAKTRLEAIESSDDLAIDTDAQVKLDGTCRYQCSNSIKMGNYNVGEISVFHSNELRNQGNMSIYVKANTHADRVKEYLTEELGFNSRHILAVCPDTFDLSICGNHWNFHAVTNSYLPQDKAKKAKIVIPVYLGSTVGIQTITFEITMSKTTVTVSKFSSSSQHPNNRVSWTIYNKNAWNQSDFEGSYNSKKGMTVSATYTYEGNLTTTVKRGVSTTGSIRYEYWIMILGNTSSYHVSTSAGTTLSHVKIYP